MEIMNFISKKYDLGKFNRICNHHECPKFPSKEILITEFDRQKEKSREIASLFFCVNHFREAHRELEKELEEFDKPLIKLEMKIFDIGYVTY